MQGKNGLKVKEFVPPMSMEIQHNKVRINVQNKDGKDASLGVMTKAEALAKAEELGGLEVILINGNFKPNLSP